MDRNSELLQVSNQERSSLDGREYFTCPMRNHSANGTLEGAEIFILGGAKKLFIHF